MPVPSNSRVQLPKTRTVSLPNDLQKMGDLSAAGVKGNSSDGIPLGMESPSQYVPGTSHINNVQRAQSDVQSHVRLRAPQTAEVFASQPQRVSAHSIVATSKPVSKPITVSRRISAVGVSALAFASDQHERAAVIHIASDFPIS
jgi:deferrochelatase/peroxidase EfeB